MDTKSTETRPIRMLWENHSGDIRQGAICDGLDLVRFSQPDDLKLTFCGPSDNQLELVAKSLKAAYLPKSSLEFSRSRIPIYAISVFGWICRLWSLRIDVVVINYVSWGPSLACAAWCLGIPVCARAGGTYNAKNPTCRWVKRYFANCPQQAAGLEGSPIADRVSIVGSFLDVSGARTSMQVKPLPERRADIPLVLFVGQLVERKGIHFLLEAVGGLQKPIDLWLVGGDWSEEGYVGQLRAAVKDLPKCCKVQLVDFRSDVLQLIEACDIFVLPSLSEARPRVIMEAMSLEKCVIATDVGGIPTLVSNGKTGVLVQPANVYEFRNALSELVAKPALRKKLGKAAGKYAQSHFDCRRTVERYLLEIHKLV